MEAVKGLFLGAEILQEGYPVFAPEESRYLASSLGEPLIKGLTEVARVRPKVPIIYLANYLLTFANVKRPESINQINGVIESGTLEEPIKQIENENFQEATKETDGSSEVKNEDSDDDNSVKVDSEDLEGPPLALESAFKPISRDEHGQTTVHFAAARTHSRNAFYQFLQESDANIGLRDELYRTARDIAEQISIPENIENIDRYTVSLAARGENNKLTELMLEGYDHITDAEDEGVNIIDISRQREHNATVSLLSIITTFEERRDKLHRAIRFGSLGQVIDAFQAGNSKMLAIAKNQQSRCCLHIAVLMQQEKITEHIANKYKETLQVGDNLMRTPLHYAMAVEKVESLAGTLINAGAQRIFKDLKGRQPSYYFMNKTDILKLQEEEEVLRV